MLRTRFDETHFKAKEVENMFAQMPWWGWVILAVLIAVVVPLKLRIMKKILGGQEERVEEEY
jgi:hypothetical protein